MQNKFTQPVSMQVTKEQYEKDLRKPLLRMGYLELGVAKWVAAPILVTNYNTGFCISNTINEYRIRHNRYFINHYNPKLFLAIAAMSNIKYGIYGEWWYCTEDVKMSSDGRIEYNKDKLYMGLDNERIINNSRDNNHYWRDDNRFEHFRKATLQELIEKFTNQKQDIMKKELTQEQFEELKNLIAPENKEKFNKLFKVNKNAIKVDLNFNDMLESLDTPFRIADASFMGIKEFAPYKNHYQKKSLVVSGQYNIDFVTIRGGHTLIMFNEKD